MSFEVIEHGIELGIKQLREIAESLTEEVISYEPDGPQELGDLIFECDRIVGWIKTSLNDLSILDDHLQAERDK